MEDCHHKLDGEFAPIDPALKKAVEAINDTEKSELHRAFAQDILTYGVDAVAHVQFTRAALRVAEGRSSLDELTARYKLHKIDDFDSKFQASIEPVKEAGIYIPPQRTSTGFQLYGHDYMNLVGPFSTFKLPRSTQQEVFGRDWQPEDFLDKELLKKALAVAKNLWAISSVNFDLKTREPISVSTLSSDLVQTAKKLTAYYDGIVEADDGHETKPEPWTIFRHVKKSEITPDSTPQVFIGTRKELKESLKQAGSVNHVHHPEIVKVLSNNTRRKLAQTLLRKKLL